VDGGEDLAAAGGQLPAGPGQTLVTEDASGDRLAFDVPHDDGVGAEGGGVVADKDDLGHRHSGPTGGEEKVALEPETRRGSSGRITPQHQTP